MCWCVPPSFSISVSLVAISCLLGRYCLACRFVCDILLVGPAVQTKHILTEVLEVACTDYGLDPHSQPYDKVVEVSKVITLEKRKS